MKKVPYLFLLIWGIFLLSGCDKTPTNRIETLRYKNKVLEFRQDKDKSFKHTPNSPLAQEQQWEFSGLNYFPVDKKFQVQAFFLKLADPEIFKIKTSSGSERIYVKAGRLDFELSGRKLSLMAYQDKDLLDKGDFPGLFVPFTDLTSGRETYGAGRYIDLAMPTAGGETFLDFNLAYNPYCAYNHNFSCPIPPPENSLDVQINAGEKNFPYKVF